MSYSDSDSNSNSSSDSEYNNEDTTVLPFEPLCLGDVIRDTCDFDICVVNNEDVSCCPNCDNETDPDEHICSVCGLDIMTVPLSIKWSEIEYQVPQLYDAVYKFLVGLGLKYYTSTANVLSKHEDRTKLGMIIIDHVSSIPDIEIRSDLTSA